MGDAQVICNLLVWGIVAHLIADWLLQNDWMAVNKKNLTHPAGWVHGGIHFAAMLFVFPWWAALILALLHVLIDTRIPLTWWFRVSGKTTEGPFAIPVALWCDQVLHISLIAVMAAVLV